MKAWVTEKCLIPLAFLTILLLLAAARPARAAKTVYPDIYFGQDGREVGLWEFGASVTLFLPSGFDAADMTLRCGGQIGAVTIDGQAFRSGDTVGLDPAGRHTLKYGKTTYTLRVLQSARTPSMFLTSMP